MKCRGCGATYDPQLEYCPYCGLENRRLKKQKEALEKKKARYESRKEQILRESADEIRLRKINRFMWILAAVTGFAFVLLTGFYILRDSSYSRTVRADEAYLEQLREEEHWGAMKEYLYEADLDRGRYGEYWQLAFFSEDAEDLRKYRDEYLNLDREEYQEAFREEESGNETDREYLISHLQFLVGRMLQDCRDILVLREEYGDENSWRAGIYGPITAEAQERLTEYEAEAAATLRLVFGLDEEQIRQLTETSYVDEEMQVRYAELVKERWLHE